MQNEKRLLPISVQSFEKLRESKCIYVDKTAYVYRLVHDVAQFFLSCPRRFGKSLLISTLKAYWEGKKELFSGLAIEKLEADNAEAWQPYPVFYFDFNGENYEITPVEDVIVKHLKRWEEIYGITDTSVTLGDRFQKVLITANEKTGKRCVMPYDFDNCGEFNAINAALLDKAEPSNLVIVSTKRTKYSIMEPCDNCKALYGGHINYFITN